MVTMTATTMAREAVKECLSPALERLEEGTRQARRAVVQGRRAAEDFIAETGLQVRRHPLMAIAMAAGAGALAGSVIGFALGRADRRMSCTSR